MPVYLGARFIDEITDSLSMMTRSTSYVCMHTTNRRAVCMSVAADTLRNVAVASWLHCRDDGHGALPVHHNSRVCSSLQYSTISDRGGRECSPRLVTEEVDSQRKLLNRPRRACYKQTISFAVILRRRRYFCLCLVLMKAIAAV